jgi:hypothetical protein
VLRGRLGSANSRIDEKPSVAENGDLADVELLFRELRVDLELDALDFLERNLDTRPSKNAGLAHDPQRRRKVTTVPHLHEDECAEHRKSDETSLGPEETH